MLKIQRTTNGDVAFSVSGRLDAGNLSELSAVLAAESRSQCLVLDLENLVLVDRDAVRFLRACRADGIRLRHCPAYIQAWMAHDEE
jgi:anti-anti-sigma regulatory factor